MTELTYSRPGDWDRIAPSPGGTLRSPATALVSIERRELALNDLGRTATTYVTCAGCKGLRTRSLNPHAPRWVRRGERHVKVDCVGREVA